MNTAASPLRRPPGRYDPPRRLPTPLLAAGAAILGLGLLALTYLAYDRFAGARTSFTLLGYGVQSEHAVEVRFSVHKRPADSVTCLIRARDRDGTEVGSEPVTIGPSTTDPVVTVRTLTTARRAATAEVTACSAAKPSPSSRPSTPSTPSTPSGRSTPSTPSGRPTPSGPSGP